MAVHHHPACRDGVEHAWNSQITAKSGYPRFATGSAKTQAPEHANERLDSAPRPSLPHRRGAANRPRRRHCLMDLVQIPMPGVNDCPGRPRGGVVTQRSAKPCTPVQFRAWPPAFARAAREGCRAVAKRRRPGLAAASHGSASRPKQTQPELTTPDETKTNSRRFGAFGAFKAGPALLYATRALKAAAVPR